MHPVRALRPMPLLALVALALTTGCLARCLVDRGESSTTTVKTPSPEWFKMLSYDPSLPEPVVPRVPTKPPTTPTTPTTGALTRVAPGKGAPHGTHPPLLPRPMGCGYKYTGRQRRHHTPPLQVPARLLCLLCLLRSLRLLHPHGPPVRLCLSARTARRKEIVIMLLGTSVTLRLLLVVVLATALVSSVPLPGSSGKIQTAVGDPLVLYLPTIPLDLFLPIDDEEAQSSESSKREVPKSSEGKKPQKEKGDKGKN
ncbi:unnamed protein product [Lampetra planeri]